MNYERALKRILSGMMCLFTVLSVSSCAFFPEEEEDLVLPIVSEAETSFKTYTVKRDNISSEISTYGSVISQDNYQQRFAVPGEIASINVSVGQTVKQGQLLATLKNTDLDKKIASANEDIDALKLLYEQNPSSANKAKLEARKADLARYNAEYQNYKLYSPINGTATFVTTKKAGDSVTVGDNIVTVSGSKSFILEVGTGMYEYVSVGMEATCEYNGQKYTGTVVFSSKDKTLNPTAYGLSSGFTGIGIKINNPPSGISANDTMSVYINLDSRENVLVIPTSAVSEFDGKTYVYVWENGIRVEREVELGIKSVTFYEVISGLSEGEVITY